MDWRDQASVQHFDVNFVLQHALFQANAKHKKQSGRAQFFFHFSSTQTGAFTTWRPASDADRRDADMHGVSLGYNPQYPHHRFRMRDQTCRDRQTSGMTRCTLAEYMRGKGLRQPLS